MLVNYIRPFYAHSLGKNLSCELVNSRNRLSRTVPRREIALHLGAFVHIVANGSVRADNALYRDQRTKGNLLSIFVGNFKVVDIAQSASAKAFRLRHNAVNATEYVKVVYINRTHIVLQGCKQGVERNIQFLGALAVYVDIQLRVRNSERRKGLRHAVQFIYLLNENPKLLLQLLYAVSGPVLKLHFKVASAADSANGSGSQHVHSTFRAFALQKLPRLLKYYVCASAFLISLRTVLKNYRHIPGVGSRHSRYSVSTRNGVCVANPVDSHHKLSGAFYNLFRAFKRRPVGKYYCRIYIPLVLFWNKPLRSDLEKFLGRPKQPDIYEHY